MKEQIIQISDTLEIKEIKDDKIILVEKEKKLTYETIAEELFKDEVTFYVNGCGEIQVGRMNPIYTSDGNNCTSKKQAEKLIAINKLMNVAKYLNGDWQPDWNNVIEYKYFIEIHNNDIININAVSSVKCGDVYFKSKEVAKKAIEILGEETIRLALCTDY